MKHINGKMARANKGGPSLQTCADCESPSRSKLRFRALCGMCQAMCQQVLR